MKLDEFAFLNQQLAGMLKAGIPLEGAIRQLCTNMRSKRLRAEFGSLEADLAKGVPLKQALASRNFPELYVQMLQVGAETGDLPSILTLLADYYHRMNSIWNRLKAVMTYPVLVLFGAFALSLFITAVYHAIGFVPLAIPQPTAPEPQFLGWVGLFAPPILFFAALLMTALVCIMPRLRGNILWRLPVFREARLARLASCLSLLLQNGCTVKSALGLLGRMEASTPMAAELLEWQSRVAEGKTRFADIATGKSLIPPLFIWLVSSDRDDWEPGLNRAAEIYQARALYQSELMLNAALPVMVIFLGALVVTQLVAIFHLLTAGAGLGVLNSLGS